MPVEYIATFFCISNDRYPPHDYSLILQAHEAIIEGYEDVWIAGTTTVLGGMIAKSMAYSEDNEYALVLTSVGDCKAYHWYELSLYPKPPLPPLTQRSSQSGRVTDVTFGNRRNVRDARDPGGRLGPYVNNVHADITHDRNKTAYSHSTHALTTLVCN